MVDHMRKVLRLIPLLGLFAAACGSNANAPTSPSSSSSLTGTWAGTATDSSTSALGGGGMMGQAGMGTMTWQLTENGSSVTGTMSFSGMPSTMMKGTLSGTMSGQDMTFTMNMPSGSMMSGSCIAQATGTMHFNGSTMTGTYSGMNSCDGPFTNGQMAMTRH